MSYRELLPPPRLRPFVDRFWTRVASGVEGASVASAVAMAAPSPALILPDGCIDVLIDVASGSARVVGTMTHAVADPLTGDASVAAVRFKPGAAGAFLRVPALELTDREIAVSDLGCRWLCARPAENGSSEAARRTLAALERALLARLPGAVLPGEVREATRRLLGREPPTVDALARELGRSRQHLARQFREHVGVSPKEFARVARLQRAIAAMQQSLAPELAAVALEVGYYDQAHMSRDFNDLAGLTPRQARAARDSIFPIPSLWLEA
ncbi:MAG TPA: helix-turn-helix transcriptional regulator [Polyangiaceae bacterium]|nr:helix-turn-helix transcriptional regulator [Polyangiaceae bacterium]